MSDIEKTKRKPSLFARVVEFDQEEIHNGVVEIQDVRKYATVLRKSDTEDSADTVCESDVGKDLAITSCPISKFTLSWSHYLLLMRIVDPVERAFYEREATQGNWSFRRLERKKRRWRVSDKSMRRETTDVRMKGARRETLDESLVSCLSSTTSRLSPHVSRHTHPKKGPQP